MRVLPLTRYEMETVISTNAAEETGWVYTRDKKQIRSLRKILASGHEGIRIVRQTEEMLEVEIPKSWVRIRPARTMSREQRAAAGERMRAMWRDRKEGRDHEPESGMSVREEES